jgi:hypothetical protein
MFWFMAKKVNDMRLAQESWGQGEVSNRRPSADSPALYLMQVWLPRFRISPPKKRLPIFVEADTLDDVPCPVKITHTV